MLRTVITLAAAGFLAYSPVGCQLRGAPPAASAPVSAHQILRRATEAILARGAFHYRDVIRTSYVALTSKPRRKGTVVFHEQGDFSRAWPGRIQSQGTERAFMMPGRKPLTHYHYRSVAIGGTRDLEKLGRWYCGAIQKGIPVKVLGLLSPTYFLPSKPIYVYDHKARAVSVTVRGQKVWRVSVSGPMNEAMYWVAKQGYLTLRLVVSERLHSGRSRNTVRETATLGRYGERLHIQRPVACRGKGR